MNRRSVIARRGMLTALKLIFLLVAGLAVTTPRALAQAALPITIGYQASPDWLVLTAKELKLFEKAGLTPTYLKFAGGPPMIAAAQNKSIDVANLGGVPFLLGLSQGVDWVMIGIPTEGAYAEGFVARKDSGIDTLADLKGKRIGFLSGSTAQVALMLALRQLGIRAHEVTLVHMSPEDQLRAMLRAEVDAALTWEPWMQRMVHEAGARIVAWDGDLGIKTSWTGYGVRRAWLRDNRETAVRFLGALLSTYGVLQKDYMVGVRAFAREMEISEAWAETIYRNAPPSKMTEWTNPRYAYSLVKGAAFHRRLGYLATLLPAEMAILKPSDVHDVLDASVIAEALKR